MGWLTKSRLRGKTAETVPFPAPLGGMNTVDPIAEMKAIYAIYLYNLIPCEYGLRARLGFQEWCTGLTGGVDNGVRSTIPYQGSRKNGSADKVFNMTAAGIWDCTNSSQSPSEVLAFPSAAGDSGFGISHAFSTPAGHVLEYCDEVNGLYQYTELTNTWAAAATGVAALWQTSTFVAAGTRVQNVGNVYVAATPGTTAANGNGPTTMGAGIADGSTGLTWNYVGAAVANVIGPSIADQNNGLYTGNAQLTATFVFVTVWGSRLWFVERDSSRAWYLPVNQVTGVATSFDFGVKMRKGGFLVGLYGWSYDGGSGMQMQLVGISSAGDIVIYVGTDPSSAASFALKGAWDCGGVPYGRRIAVESGGEVFVLSLLGALPLSKLITGSSIFDRAQYATKNIHNLFNLLAQTFKTLPGWSIHIHPQDNALLIVIPQPAGYPNLQLAMSFSTQGWGQYRNLPILSAGVLNGQFYFGTADGRVCVNQGYVDNVQLANPAGYVPVAWSLLHAFVTGGNMRQKLINMLRPVVLSGVNAPGLQAVAKFDYDTSEPLDTSSVGGNAGWDVAQWDVAQWTSDYTPQQTFIGAAGMGRAVSVAVRGQAVSRTIYVSTDAMGEQGTELG